MTVGELVLKLINFNPNEEIFFYEEENNDILDIADIGDHNALPYIVFKKENKKRTGEKTNE